MNLEQQTEAYLRCFCPVYKSANTFISLQNLASLATWVSDLPPGYRLPLFGIVLGVLPHFVYKFFTSACPLYHTGTRGCIFGQRRQFC